MPSPVQTLLRTALLAWLLWAVGSPQARAQLPAPTPSPSPPAQVPSELASPRATLATFLEAMAEASPLRPGLEARARETLDLAPIPPLLRIEQGNHVARKLHEALQAQQIDPETIPAEVEGDRWIVMESGGVEVALEKQPEGIWQFSAETVRQADQLASPPEAQPGQAPSARPAPPPPEPLLSRPFLGLAAGVWLIMGLGLLAAWATSRLFRLILTRLLRRWSDHEGLELGPEVRRGMVRAASWLVASALLTAALPALSLPPDLHFPLIVSLKLVVSTATVLTLYRGVDLLTAWLVKLNRGEDTVVDEMLLPLTRRILKLLVAFVGFLFVAQNLEFNVWSLFAGFSIVGAAVALAGQDTVKNLFGSITVLLDRPFRVGDWICVGEVEGTVEELGFRSTRIRTLQRSLITLPNAQLLTASVDNFGDRTSRPYTTTLALVYETTPDRIRAFCEGLEEIVERHPLARSDNLLIFLSELGASSLDLTVSVSFQGPNLLSHTRPAMS